MKFVLIGAGQRGMIYAQNAQKRGHEIAAVAETDPVRRAIAAGEFGIPEERCFSSGEALLAQPRMGEAAIIATMDRDHFHEAVPAMEKGYHLLLEKPISPLPEETLAIEKAAERTALVVIVLKICRNIRINGCLLRCVGIKCDAAVDFEIAVNLDACDLDCIVHRTDEDMPHISTPFSSFL